MSVEEVRIDAALGFIDQTVYANSENGPTGTWRTDEVMAMLSDLREILAPKQHDHDPGGCTCGCPIEDCAPCGGFIAAPEPTGENE